MDIRKLQRVIVDGLEDVKAQNIVVFNTEHLSSLFERVIIASGTSNRQTKSLAASVRDAVKAIGAPPPRTEGEANGEWIIVDCGAAVVHVMQPAIREYYHLEELWGEKPVKMKIESVTPRLVKAAPAARERAGAREAGAARPSARDAAPAKRAASASRATPGKKTTPAKKTTAAKKTVSSRSAPPARRAPAKRIGILRVGEAKGVVRTVGVKKSSGAAKSARPAVRPAAKRAAPKR
jgi:ribosome-associated protein